MEITYIHHSCFLAQGDKFSILFDYWTDPTTTDARHPRFLDTVRRDCPLYVFVSHHHKDHFNQAIFRWASEHPDIRYILSDDIARFARHYLRSESSYRGPKPNPDQVKVLKPGENYKDDILEIHAFGSTDCGCSWLVTPTDESGQPDKSESIFHAGDLNAWIWIEESTPEEVEEATSAYSKILKEIANTTGRIGYCLFPVDSRIGSHWYLGAEMIVREIAVDHFFPMHFTLADCEEEKRKRIEDACRFDLYANRKHGEYIALTTPYTGYLNGGK